MGGGTGSRYNLRSSGAFSRRISLGEEPKQEDSVTVLENGVVKEPMSITPKAVGEGSKASNRLPSSIMKTRSNRCELSNMEKGVNFEPMCISPSQTAKTPGRNDSGLSTRLPKSPGRLRTRYLGASSPRNQSYSAEMEPLRRTPKAAAGSTIRKLNSRTSAEQEPPSTPNRMEVQQTPSRKAHRAPRTPGEAQPRGQKRQSYDTCTECCSTDKSTPSPRKSLPCVMDKNHHLLSDAIENSPQKYTQAFPSHGDVTPPRPQPFVVPSAPSRKRVSFPPKDSNSDSCSSLADIGELYPILEEEIHTVPTKIPPLNPNNATPHLSNRIAKLSVKRLSSPVLESSDDDLSPDPADCSPSSLLKGHLSLPSKYATKIEVRDMMGSNVNPLLRSDHVPTPIGKGDIALQKLSIVGGNMNFSPNFLEIFGVKNSKTSPPPSIDT